MLLNASFPEKMVIHVNNAEKKQIFSLIGRSFVHLKEQQGLKEPDLKESGILVGVWYMATSLDDFGIFILLWWHIKHSNW